jgi:hypothetical protein
MEANGATQRRDSALGKDDDMGPYLTQIKTSGGMTISPELFEKVKIRTCFLDDIIFNSDTAAF